MCSPLVSKLCSAFHHVIAKIQELFYAFILGFLCIRFCSFLLHDIGLYKREEPECFSEIKAFASSLISATVFQ